VLFSAVLADDTAMSQVRADQRVQTSTNRRLSGDIELLFSSNIAPRFEDTEHKEICLSDLSGQKVGGTQNAKHLNKRGRIYRPDLILYSQPR